MRVGGTPVPVHAPPAAALEDVTIRDRCRDRYRAWCPARLRTARACRPEWLRSAVRRCRTTMGRDAFAERLVLLADGVEVDRFADAEGAARTISLSAARESNRAARKFGLDQVGDADAAAGRSCLRSRARCRATWCRWRRAPGRLSEICSTMRWNGKMTWARLLMNRRPADRRCRLLRASSISASSAAGSMTTPLPITACLPFRRMPAGNQLEDDTCGRRSSTVWPALWPP